MLLIMVKGHIFVESFLTQFCKLLTLEVLTVPLKLSSSTWQQVNIILSSFATAWLAILNHTKPIWDQI